VKVDGGNFMNRDFFLWGI